MKSILNTIQSWFPSPSAVDKEEVRQVRPFFWLVVIGLIFVYTFSLRGDPGLREPARLIPFTALILVHGVIHWNMLRFAKTRPATIVYLIVQGALGMAIIVIGNNIGLTYGIFMSLIGEVLGLLGLTPFGLASAAYFILLSGIGFLLTSEMDQFWIWAATALGILPVVVIYVWMLRRQMDAREKAQTLLAELETAHRQLSEYAVQVEDLTLAAERRRMARELHDTLSQGLAGLILQIEAAGAHLDNQNTDKAQAVLRQALTRARETLADARRAIGDLREIPGVDPDLVTALEEEIERFQGLTGISCQADLDVRCEVPEALRETVARVAAEGLFNIAMHAQASQASLKLSCGGEELFLSLRDDGIGFDPGSAVGASGHYGLLGLRERCRLAGGTLEISSRPGEGSQLTVRLPLNFSAGEAA
ncbi:MAG: sensor histidine kinase [Anaerolineaceae bacterium]|nr:sensor histidine kinase [Anaerolineaceae bacterium]